MKLACCLESSGCGLYVRASERLALLLGEFRLEVGGFEVGSAGDFDGSDRLTFIGRKNLFCWRSVRVLGGLLGLVRLRRWGLGLGGRYTHGERAQERNAEQNGDPNERGNEGGGELSHTTD